MSTFYLSMDCENCEEEILYGPCGTTEEHRGLPVIPFDMASQSKFECERCNAKHFTGDFDDVHVDGGDPDPVVFDEDEDGEEEE